MTRRRPSPQPRRLIAYYKNAKSLGAITNQQLIILFASTVAVGMVVLCVVTWYAYEKGHDAQRTGDQAKRAADQAKAATAATERLRKEGRAQRLADQARTDLEIAHLACVQIKYAPGARSEVISGLTGDQKKLVANCKNLPKVTSPTTGARPGATSPSSPPAPRAPSSTTPTADGQPTKSTPSTKPQPTTGSTTTGASAGGVLDPILKTVHGVLCGALGIC